MASPKVVKVCLDGKKPIQTVQTLDTKRNLVVTTITAYWLVQFDSVQADPTACYGATDGTKTLPAIGNTFSGDASDLRTCFRLLPMLDPQSKGQVYRVQVDYSNDLTQNSTNSGLWDVKVELNGVAITESYYFDLDGFQVTNSAGQNFSNQPSRTFYDTALRVSFNTRTFDEAAAEARRGLINSGNVVLRVSALNYSRTFPPATLRLDTLTTSPITNAGQVAYWQVSMDFTHRDLADVSNVDTVDPNGTAIDDTSLSTLEYDIITDQGFAYKDSGSGQLVPFKDKDGNPLNAPGLLNGQGAAVHANGSSFTPKPTDATFICFRKADRADFSVLFAGIA